MASFATFRKCFTAYVNSCDQWRSRIGPQSESSSIVPADLLGALNVEPSRCFNPHYLATQPSKCPVRPPGVRAEAVCIELSLPRQIEIAGSIPDPAHPGWLQWGWWGWW